MPAFICGGPFAFAFAFPFAAVLAFGSGAAPPAGLRVWGLGWLGCLGLGIFCNLGLLYQMCES